METKSVAEIINSCPPFEPRVPESYRFTNEKLNTLQVNVGYKCNLACKHCHLQCSPKREETMSRKVMQACLDAYETGGFTSMDVTGGAIELHPDIEWFLTEAKSRGVALMCRTNLCILLDPAFAHMANVYSDLDVVLVASLPHYVESSVDKVRGNGVFEQSIKALRLLNEKGFGTGQHTLMLVYNPAGAVLPPSQASLEAEYKAALHRDYGVSFDTLIAIANCPGGRFAERLNAKGNLEKYLNRLIGAFNEATCAGMMCRDQISVDYNGNVYDCDFNQALGLPCEGNPTIFDFANAAPQKRHIAFGNHCYGCTAGAGSSCGGATA